MGADKDIFMEQREVEQSATHNITTHEQVDINQIEDKYLPIELNRAKIKAEVEKITTAVTNGEINPLNAFLFVKYMEDVSKSAKEALGEQAINEALKHGKDFEYNGAKVNIKSSPGRWDYKHLPEWIEAEQKVKAIEENAKQSYQNAAKGVITASNDGEVIEAAKYTPGKEIIAVTFKK